MGLPQAIANRWVRTTNTDLHIDIDRNNQTVIRGTRGVTFILKAYDIL